MFGFPVFAGLYALLGLFPRRMPGLWELALYHKVVVTAFLAYFVAHDPFPERVVQALEANVTIDVDLSRVVVTLVA